MKNKLSNDILSSYWLLTCAAFVFLMALVGAATRLTESGLSITEWRPITGMLPPLSYAEWLQEFEKYRATPEYRYKNVGMTLAEFKYIFYWEWGHRQLGRFIGLIYALPLLYFWLTNRIADGYGRKFLWLLALGALQGVAGWWMVTSGLSQNPNVSHYRLSVHLGLAIIIMSCMYWMGLTLLRRSAALIMPPVRHNTPGLRRYGWFCLVLVAITITWGAFVAGLSAGLIYNEWPLMGHGLIPIELKNLDLLPFNLFSEHATVQFAHRWLAMLTVIALIIFAWRVDSPLLAATALLQLGLGISTLVLGVPILLGTLHQGGALLTLAVLLYQLHRITYSAAKPS